MPKTVSISDLKEREYLAGSVLSPEGIRLIAAGEPLTERAIAALGECGFTEVVLTDSEDDEEEALRGKRYESKPLAEVGDKEIVAMAIYDAQDRLLVTAGQPIPSGRRATLEKSGVVNVFVEKPLPPEAELRIGRFFMKLNETRKQTRTVRITLKVPPVMSLAPEREITDSKTITEEAVEKEIEAAKFDDAPKGPPLKAIIVPVDPLSIRPIGKVKAVIHVHGNVLRNAEQIFAQVRAHKHVDGDLLARLAQSVITGLINDPALTLNLAAIENSPYYLISHSINTVLLSVSIGSHLGYSAGQIHELAYGAFLHDIGMMRMPKEILFKTSPLTRAERLHVEQHPVFGINILQDISGLPKSAPLVVYQENERVNGTGYPRRRHSGLIHSYAKIVAVAATYEAMAADRPHRGAMLPYHAMELMLKQVKEGKFDAVVVRALLKALSLFPIGSWMRLSDGSVARTVAANEHSFTRPVVSVIIGPDGERLVKALPINLLDPANSDLYIAEPIPTPEEFKKEARTIGF